MARGLRYVPGAMGKLLRINSKAVKASSEHFRSILLLLTAVSTASLLTGCLDDGGRTVIVDTVVADNLPPLPPDGVYSVTGDQQVTLYWNPNREPDLAGYDLYWNDGPTGYYKYFATVGKNQNWYTDTDVQNGETIYYAVLAFDLEGLESELSYETVFDTPRPEGRGLIMFDYMGQNDHLSGYDFSSLSGAAQAWNDPSTDVYFGFPNGVPTLFAGGEAGVDIQDYGYIDLVDVDWAPESGWSNAGQVELIQGHSYVVRIVDRSGAFNMAKLYTCNVASSSVTLDWAYQADPDNLELAPGGGAQP